MDTSQKQELSSPPAKRLYQIWPGNNRFFFDGRLMLGPMKGLKKSITTLLTLVVLEILFILFICPYIWVTVSRMIPISSMSLFIISICLMILTIITDPGIIPRREIFEVIGTVPEIFASEGNDKKRLCKTCNIYKPKRSNHCRQCDNCVEVFDHHCSIVNNCIGKNNYKWFVAMVIGLTLHGGINISGLVLFFFGDQRERRSRKFYVVIENDTFLTCMAVVLISVFILLTLFVFLLCMFHIRLSISGETTKEYMLSLNKESDRGLIKGKYWFHPRLIIQSVQV